MNSSKRHSNNNFHNGFHRSSHYFRSSQPECSNAKEATSRPSKKKIIDVFEFEPVGFMSHGRW